MQKNLKDRIEVIQVLLIRIDMVNERQYSESEIYKEIKIVLPRSKEELEKDFSYLDLNYSNSTRKDTHIKECEFIDKQESKFAYDISKLMNDLIYRANDSGYSTPFENIKEFYNIVKKMNSHEREKLLAIMEAKREQIDFIGDAIKYAQNIDCFELEEIFDSVELARDIVHKGKIEIEDVMEYADLDRLGNDYAEDNKMVKTKYGYLKQEKELTNYIEQNNEEELE